MQAAGKEIVEIHDLKFKKLIDSEKIQNRILELGTQLNEDFKEGIPIFVCVLNGAFVFCSDLVRSATINCEIEFVKVSSYEGTESSGNIKKHIGLSKNIENRHVVLVEDIIDKGHTINYLIKEITNLKPASLKIASLLFKPAACLYDLKVDYLGFEIPPDFVVGYGLDYNAIGRSLRHIYTKV